MGFWYSKNVKLLFRSEFGSYYRTSSVYYGYAHNGENFVATNGNTYTYMYNSGYDSSSSLANQHARENAYYRMAVPLETSVGNYVYICMDNGVFDDTKYDYSGEVSGLSLSRTASYPGSTIFNVTNSTNQPVTFNAIEWVAKPYLSNSNSDQGTTGVILTSAYICDSPVTLAPGQTYSIEFTV